MVVLRYKAVSKNKPFMQDYKEFKHYFESGSWTTEPLHPSWSYIRKEVIESELLFELLHEH